MFTTDPLFRTIASLEQALSEKQEVSVRSHSNSQSNPSTGTVRLTLDKDVFVNVVILNGYITKLYPEPPPRVHAPDDRPQNVPMRRMI